MYALWQDIRYAARKLSRTPAFTVVVVITIALGVGATTAITSVVNSVLVEPLPFKDPSRLLFVETMSPQGKPMTTSPQNFLDFLREAKAFSDMAPVIDWESQTLTRPGAIAVRLNEARVGASFFSVLGVEPELGRYFARDEDSKDAPRVVVLSHFGWMKYFGGDRHVIGRHITLDGNSYQVVGVAPPSLAYPKSVDAWVPAVWRDYEIGDNARGFNEVKIVGRLAPHATVDGARAELGTIMGRIARDFPRTNAKMGIYVEGLQRHVVGDVGHALWALLGAVGLVLLIACANVANLLLVRASSRESELAVRTALGAGRARLVRQLVTESLVLSVIGSALGVLFAAWALSAVIAFGPRGLPRINEIAIDGRVLAFTTLLAIVVGVAFGLVPALHSVRADVSSMLRAGARGAGGRANRTRAGFVLAQVALATVLLVGAGLLLRSFERLTHKNPGFDPVHLVVFDVSLPGTKYEIDDALNRFAAEVTTRLAALPGTEHVAVAAERPFDPDSPFHASTSFTVDGDPRPEPGAEPEARLLPVSPNYFTTVGQSLARGRAFRDEENRRDGRQVLVINEALAEKYFPGQNPIGKRLTFGLSHNFTTNSADSIRVRGEVVGIAKDAASESVAQRQEPVAYIAYATLPLGATFLIRTTSDPSAVEGAIQRLLHDVDPDVPIYELGPMGDALAASMAQPRFYSILLAAFAGIALLLAALGIFGVITYAVSQRTREFGIRIALGATAMDVSRAVVQRGVTLSVMGIALGVGAAIAATGVIRALLFETDALDVPTFVAVAALLLGVATLASWLPARRAGRVDPTVAMRAE